MIAESGKASFLMILISDPESNSKFVLVFKSGETILAVGVRGVSFIFIEIIWRDRRPNLSPTLGDSCLLPRGFLSSSVLDSPDFLIVLERDWTMALPECLSVLASVLRESFVAFGCLPSVPVFTL